MDAAAGRPVRAGGLLAARLLTIRLLGVLLAVLAFLAFLAFLAVRLLGGGRVHDLERVEERLRVAAADEGGRALEDHLIKAVLHDEEMDAVHAALRQLDDRFAAGV